MRNILVWLVAVAITCLLTLGLVRQQQFAQGNRLPTDLFTGSQPVDSGSYCLGAWQGRLAVFLPGQSEPEMVFDVYLQQLPALDQTQLEQGIWVADYTTLVAKIEDYIS